MFLWSYYFEHWLEILRVFILSPSLLSLLINLPCLASTLCNCLKHNWYFILCACLCLPSPFHLSWSLWCGQYSAPRHSQGQNLKKRMFFPLLLPIWPNSIFSLEYHSLLVPLCKKNNNIQKQNKKNHIYIEV